MRGALSRLMPNSWLKQYRRTLLSSMVKSMLSYGTQLWDDTLGNQELLALQARCLKTRWTLLQGCYQLEYEVTSIIWRRCYAIVISILPWCQWRRWTCVLCVPKKKIQAEILAGKTLSSKAVWEVTSLFGTEFHQYHCGIEIWRWMRSARKKEDMTWFTWSSFS